MTSVDKDLRRACLPRPVACLAGAAALVLCGCVYETAPSPSTSSSTRSGGGSAEALLTERQQAFQIDHDAYASLGYQIDWRGFPVVARGRRISFLDVYPDIVVAQESGATVSILEANTGALRNSSQVASPLTRFVGNFRDENRLIVSSDTEAYVIDIETGSVVERQEFSRVVSTRPVFFANQKIYGTAIGHVYSHYMNPPVDAWAYDLGSPIDADPVLVGSTVVAVSRRGDIAMLDGASGTLMARTSIYGGCEADPVAGDGVVFFASLDQSIYAIDLGGRQVWRVRTEQPLRVTPTHHAGVLYVPSADQGLRALDAGTGAQLWNQEQVQGRVVAVRNGRLVTWDGTTAATIDPANGDVIASTGLTDVAMLTPDQFVDGNLYAASNGGIVAKFQPRD
ncbi:MAG TPA: PQQ-binding-like beta-propeller repeat protein [Phycisphaerales bacterium]|nr:PQQ-binding-like beta-propeller repeat protein [Phycisphaerales bacterium]